MPVLSLPLERQGVANLLFFFLIRVFSSLVSFWRGKGWPPFLPSREATAGHPLSSSFLFYSPVLLEKLSPSIERGNVVTILCLREKQVVAVLSRLLEGKGLTIIVLETLVARGVATHALLLLF